MKLSEEYFEHVIVWHSTSDLKSSIEISVDRIKTYGLIREIEGKISTDEDTLIVLIEFVENSNTDFVPSTINGLISGLKIVIQNNKDQLTTIRKEAGL